MKMENSSSLNQEKVSFDAWLLTLNKIAKWNGYRDVALVGATGADTWLPAYTKGLSPAAALEEAEEDGKNFGKDYIEG